MDLRELLQSTLGGSYTFERELGGGGMSRVFVAYEQRLRRRVAIKILSPETAAAISTERFEREIQVAASLQQANIVPVLTAGETNGLPYFTMPFVEGESLRVRLTRTGPLSIKEAVKVLGDVARALAYAHERGVVHRDIKPDNVLLSGGTAVVTDFGIAKAIAAARTGAPRGDPTLTQLGTAVGTPAYMAPEQAAADPHIDHRADLYAFGCTAFEMLSGRPPFTDRTPQRLLAAHMGEMPPSIADLRPDTPPTLADLIARCLAKEPTGRPASAGELLQILDSVASTGSAVNGTLPPILVGGPGMVKRALVYYALAFVVVALVAKAATVAIGLPDWVFPGALAVMALGLPVILFTAYVAYVARRAALNTPAITPGGTRSIATKGTMATLALKASPHVSWNRTARGGVWAVSAFVVAVVAWMVMRVLGIGPAGSLLSSGKLGANDKVLVADFKVGAVDSVLGPALATLMSTSLSQSGVVHLVPGSTIAAALQRMQRPADSRIDLALARDIATREGVRAVVAGEVTPLSGGYLVSVKLMSPNGDALWQGSETVDGAKQLTAAVDKLARQLRGKAGESLRSVRAEPPLAQVTTSSLEALRKYSDGLRAYSVESDNPKAQRLLEEAVNIDTTFAAGWVRLTAVLYNGGVRPADQTTYIERAYRMQDRLSDPERLAMLAFYHIVGRRRERQKNIDYQIELGMRYPTWPLALNNAAIAIEGGLHNHVRAESVYVRAIATLPDERFAYTNIVAPQIALGKFAEAHKSIARAREKLPEAASRVVEQYLGFIYYNEWRLDSAAAAWRRAASLSAGRAAPVSQLADLSLVRGRVVEYQTLHAANVTSNRARGVTTTSLSDSIGVTLAALVGYSDDPAAAVARLDALLASTPTTALTRGNLVNLVRLYSIAGRADRAATFLAEYDKSAADTNLARPSPPVRQYLQGLVAIAQGRPAEAVRLFRQANAPPYSICEICVDRDMALAFEVARMPDSALVAYEHFANTPYNLRVAQDFELPITLRRLGELYEQKGNSAKAMQYYQRFVDLWKDADAQYLPKVAEIRRRMIRLSDTERRPR